MSLTRASAGAPAGIFNGIVRTAAAAGVAAGLLLTAVQHLQVIPIIQQAEVYEAARAAGPAAPANAAAHTHANGEQHTHAAAASSAAGADDAHADAEAHSHGGWEPEDGLERTLYTALADVSMAVGYALLLAAILCLRGGAMNWRRGLLWGAAGYAVVFIAPSFGLPPELPGTAAAPVGLRQGWWLCTALSTSVALAMLVYGRKLLLKIAAVALLFVPHLVGAPQPPVHLAAAPQELVSAFIVATALANAVFWLALGALTGYFHQRYNLSAAS